MKLIRSLPRCCRSWLGQIRGARAGTQNLGLTTFSNARPERVAWIEETELNIQGKTVGPAWSIVVGVRAPDGNVTVVDRESLMIDDSKPDLPERVVWVELIEHPQSNGPVCTLFVGKSKPDGALIVRHRFPWYELMSNDPIDPLRVTRGILQDEGFYGYWTLRGSDKFGVDVVTQRACDGPWLSSVDMHPDSPVPMKYWKVREGPPPEFKGSLISRRLFNALIDCTGEAIAAVPAVIEAPNGNGTWDDYYYMKVPSHVDDKDLWNREAASKPIYATSRGDYVVSEEVRQCLVKAAPQSFEYWAISSRILGGRLRTA